MPQIPLGDFGNAIPQSPGRTNLPAQAFDAGGSGLQEVARTAFGIASDMAEAQAISEATTEIQRGKLDLDAFVSEIERTPYAADGQPLFRDAAKRFEEFSRERMARSIEAASTPRGKQAIQKDLGNYALGLRQKVGEASRTLEVAHYRARGAENIELAVASGDERQVDLVLAGMVNSGVMAADDAFAARGKATYRIEYGRAANLINAATTKEQLFEARGRLSVFNAKLSPEDNRALLSEVNSRIDRFDRDAEKALRTEQEATARQLQDMATLGKLDADTLLLNSDKLSREDRNLFGNLVRQFEREGGRDDPDVVRRLQIGVHTGTVDEATLNRIAAGYDPRTGEASAPRISAGTYRQLMGDLRTLRDDAQQQGQRKFSNPEYEQAREYLRLRIGQGKDKWGNLDPENAKTLSNALTSLYQRAEAGETGHLRWAQEYEAVINAPTPAPRNPAKPGTTVSGKVTRSAPPRSVFQITPEQQRARDDKRVEVLRSELASERSSLAIAKEPAARRRAEQNIRAISQELRNLKVTP